ncbi:hypothetical protein V9L05_01220 [Bernardetia sp. Wsw4-3y2]|uniref:hypothetical protein n=1 Tax=Bernardetia sp. Wsw4-3y2 TaxID=3127471 RepID=UPI0030D225DA
MLEISTGSASLDLQNDAKITIKQKSSLFTILEKEDKQSYSYPFTLPRSRINNSVISNTLEEQKAETLQAILRANGVRLFKADLITKRSNTGYEVNLQLNKKVDLFNRKLNTLFDELGTFFITEDNHFVDLELRSVIINAFTPWSNFTGSITAVVTGISYTVTSTWDNLMSDLANAINADTNSNAIATPNGIDRIKIERFDSNLPFYAYADNTKTTNSVNPSVLAFLPYLNDSFYNKTLAKTHANAIYSLVDFRNSEYCFPFFLAEIETDSTNPIGFPFIAINAVDQSTAEYEAYNDAVFLPNFRITALIEKILSLVGWKLESDFLKDIEVEKLFLTNAYAVAEKNSGTWHITQYLQFFVADCLPDISFAELITELQSLFCINADYDHTRKILKIDTANSIISNKLAKEYECTEFFSEKEKETASGYILKYNLEEKMEKIEKLNTGFLTSKIIGNGKLPIVSNFPFLPLYQAFPDVFAFPFLEGGLRMPNSFAKFGYVQGFNILQKEFWLKEGVVKSINFMSYVDKQAKFQTNNYSLLWEVLYNQFWKNYLELLDKSEVEREIIFTFSELQSLDLLKRIRLEYSNYYIKELEYTLTNNEQFRILAKVNLIKTI